MMMMNMMTSMMMIFPQKMIWETHLD